MICLEEFQNLSRKRNNLVTFEMHNLDGQKALLSDPLSTQLNNPVEETAHETFQQQNSSLAGFPNAVCNGKFKMSCQPRRHNYSPYSYSLDC
jgi:hypothetical protein